MPNHSLFLKAGFINVPLQNGINRYVGQLQRVVLKFCKNHGSSRGMRNFIETELVNFAKENPGTVVYLKPRRHRAPVLKAEYLNGETQWMSCSNFSKEEILKWMNLLRSQQTSHDGTRVRKLWHTDHPSIQGPWTPYTFRDPKLNLVEYPDEEQGRSDQRDHVSYDELMELFKKQETGNKAEGVN